MTRIGNNRVTSLKGKVLSSANEQSTPKPFDERRDSFERDHSQQAPSEGFASKLRQHVERFGALEREHSGEAVAELQQLLNRAGAEPLLRLDGALGPQTEAALRKFQAQQGVTVDGVFGVKSLHALGNVFGQTDLLPAAGVQGTESSKPLKSVLQEHTARVSELEDEKQRGEHDSPILNVRKLPTHGSLKPMMVSTTQIPERDENSKPSALAAEDSVDDLPQISFRLPESSK